MSDIQTQQSIHIKLLSAVHNTTEKPIMRLHYIIPESLKNVICLIFCNYKKLQPSLSLSVLTAIFLGEPGLASFIEAKDDGSGGANCSSKTCKDPAKLSPPANQHPTFLQARCLPVAQPTVSKH